MHFDGSLFFSLVANANKISPNQENSCDCNARNVFDIVLMLAPAVAAVRYIAVAGFLSIYVSFIASSSTLFWFELKAVFEPFTFNYSCGSNSSIRFGRSILRNTTSSFYYSLAKWLALYLCSKQGTHFHQIKTQNCLISCDKLLSRALSLSVCLCVGI